MGIIERIKDAFRPATHCEGCHRSLKVCDKQCAEAAELDAEWMNAIR